jgi:hypothetical protein
MGMNYTCVLLSVAPLLYLLSDLLPLPHVRCIQTMCDWLWGGGLKCTVDHILQEFYTLFLTRFGWVRRIPHLLMHLFLDEGFKHRLHSPQLSAVQLTQLGLPQTRPLLQCKGAVFRIHDILGWIRIRILGSMLPTGGSGSGFWIQMLLFSSLTFQMPAKK